jgi:hypothetical protein
MRLETHDQEQIHNLDNSVRMRYREGSTTRGLRQQLGVLDADRPSIRQMDVEWLKRPNHMQVLQLLDGHMGIVTGLLRSFNRKEPGLMRDTRHSILLNCTAVVEEFRDQEETHNVSIVRIGLGETKHFAEGYEAIFGKKAEGEKKPAQARGKKAAVKKKKKTKKR